MLYKITRQQHENLLDALLNMWPSVPPENVYPSLNDWRDTSDTCGNKKPSCQTVACFGGWCAWWPAFRRQGVRAMDCGAPVTPDGRTADGVSRLLFGCGDLFCCRGIHSSDGGFRGTDHELVTNRLKFVLRNCEVTQ